MASDRYLFHLFEVIDSHHLLIRTTRPGYANANQSSANLAESTAELKLNRLINLFILNKPTLSLSDIILIGEFQGLPEGDVLYDEHGKLALENLWFTETTFGKPWIYLSIAKNEEEFWLLTDEEDFAENGYKKEQLIAPVIQLNSVTFITESDHDLSDIPFYNVKEIE